MGNNEDFDYSGFEVAPPESGFDNLDLLISEQRSAEEDVEKLESELRTAKGRLTDVSERQLPELMDEMGLVEFVTKKGFKIKIKKTLRCSIAGDRKRPAMAWLTNHGHGDIVKKTVTVPFMTGQEKQSDELLEELKERFGTAGQDSKVENSTLRSLLTQLMKKGVEVPMDVFGIFEQKTAKISV